MDRAYGMESSGKSSFTDQYETFYIIGQREREVRNKNDLFQFFDLMRSLLFHAYNSSTIRLIKEE